MAFAIEIDDLNKELWRQRNKRIENLLGALYRCEEQIDEDDACTMEVRLYELATVGDNVDAFIDELEVILSKSYQQSLKSIVFDQVSPSGNSLLHVAVAAGSENITRILVTHLSYLITKTNFEGDTALHVAARAGMLNTLQILVHDFSAPEKESLLRKRNNKGNTALHEAVSNDRKDVASFLLSLDSELAYHQNYEVVSQDIKKNIEKGKSPLYLAVEKGLQQMVGIILTAITQHRNALNRLEGSSPAHAAIKTKNLVILEQIANAMPELTRAKETGGNNVFHLASSVGFLHGVKLLIKKKFKDLAIERNEEGAFPIHFACKMGHLKIVNELLNEWPNPMEFVDNKGRNILHVAAEHGRENVLKYLLKRPELKELRNEKDKEGNTPLHLAAKHGSPLSVFALVLNKNVHTDIVNHENLTPFGIAETQSIQLEEENFNRPTPHYTNKKLVPDDTIDDEGTVQSKSFYKQLDFFGVMMTFSILYFHRRPKIERTLIENMRIPGKILSKDEVRSRIEILLVAAVLVAGAAFNAACQVPGGNSSNSDSENTLMEVLHYFYFLLDSIALNFSVAAAIILCWVQLYDVKIASHAVWLASIMVGSSIYFLFVTFLFALLIDVYKGQITALFIASIAMEGAFAVFFLLLCIPLVIPPEVNKTVEKYVSPVIYYYLFLYHFVLQKGLGYWVS
ncbi:hypothetical protein JCGZ_25802 [Jatropha curcas]|uniref:PGG domain-containing protein n=1 Tax=Jatropha curcas TaxID=180498 RepID=A0A067JVY7_JATCU|nr:hypothetical protein JCGZ_25802 [Jatropha curcas]